MEINMSLQPIEIIEQILGAYAEDGSAMRCDEIHAYLTAFVSGPDGIADDADAVIDAVIGDAAIDAAQRERIKETVLQWAEELKRNLKDKQLPELPLYKVKDFIQLMMMSSIPEIHSRKNTHNTADKVRSKRSLHGFAGKAA